MRYKHLGTYRGSGMLPDTVDAAVKNTEYLYELAHGDLSGWIYRVNGESPSVGCASYTLSDGDTVEWHYTLNQGKDIPQE